MTAAQMIENRRQKSPADARLIAVTEAKTSAVLLAAHATLDAKGYDLAAEERLVLATIADVLTARHDLDAAIDAIYEDDDSLEITYHEALLLALAATNAEV